MCKVAWTSLYLLGIISSRKNKLYPSSKACTLADTSLLILVSISFQASAAYSSLSMCKVAWTNLYLLGITSSRKNKLYPNSKACTLADTSLLILVSTSFWLRAWICNGKGSLYIHTMYQPLCLWWLIWPIQNDAINLKNETLTHIWVLI